MGFWNVIFVKNDIFENEIFVKKGLLKCDFCENWDFENAIFVKNVILKLWIMWFWTCEFLDKMWIFAPVCWSFRKSSQNRNFCLPWFLFTSSDGWALFAFLFLFAIFIGILLKNWVKIKSMIFGNSCMKIIMGFWILESHAKQGNLIINNIPKI